MSRNNRARRFCLTLNNWTEEEYKKILDTLSTKKFYIIGKEIGSNCYTEHLQIYFESKNAVDFDTIKRWNNRLHIEKASGCIEANYVYCSKDKDFVTNIIEKNLDQEKLKIYRRKNETILNDDELSIHFGKHWNNEKLTESLELIDYFIENFDSIFEKFDFNILKNKINNMIKLLEELIICKLCKTDKIIIYHNTLLRLKDNYINC